MSKVKIAVLKELVNFWRIVRLLEGGIETLFGQVQFEHLKSLHWSSLTVLIINHPLSHSALL